MSAMMPGGRASVAPRITHLGRSSAILAGMMCHVPEQVLSISIRTRWQRLNTDQRAICVSQWVTMWPLCDITDCHSHTLADCLTVWPDLKTSVTAFYVLHKTWLCTWDYKCNVHEVYIEIMRMHAHSTFRFVKASSVNCVVISWAFSCQISVPDLPKGL